MVVVSYRDAALTTYGTESLAPSVWTDLGHNINGSFVFNKDSIYKICFVEVNTYLDVVEQASSGESAYLTDWKTDENSGRSFHLLN